MKTDPQAAASSLVELMAGFGSCAVAFSGGVDSAVVAKAAQLALGSAAVAVTGRSASLAAGELEAAIELASLIGIRHVVVETGELDQVAYTANGPDRCFHCKTELYTQLETLAGQLQTRAIANGANLDDLGDYRPGMKAAANHEVRSPLAECRLDKAAVRELAQFWELPVWDKPAMPCLSSRVAYGEPVTPERLAMIDGAEQFLRSLGFKNLRVRYHRGDMARIEVPPEAIAQLTATPAREAISAEFRRLGFRYVTLDLEGFSSGSMNRALGLGQLPVVN
ncbi:MAG TPA: ATP-dependent sacrificial sulfur transferase LarE [Pirellulales bacterium]|nr:ATP-dependent sacrificial sulfur transferase LarE [Pirellulales bacterium]